MKKLIVCLFIFILIGCMNKPSEEVTKIRLDGSTSMEKYVNALREAIEIKYPNIRLEPQFTGSATGIQSLIQSHSDIGNASRYLKAEEKEKGAVENIVALDAIAIIVHKDHNLNNLSKDQLIQIYQGKIRNWKEINGQQQPIVVIGREASSGTRTAFEDNLKIEGQCAYARELNESGAIVAAVAATPGAIGYVSLDVLTDKVKALSIDGIYPSIEAVQKGDYTLQRPFIMATYQGIDKQEEKIQLLFEFIYSEEGQQLAQYIGLVPVKRQ